MPKIKVAIVGFGGMGRRWAKIANDCHESSLNLIIDTDEKKLKEVKEYWKCNFDSDLKALSSPEIDAVVVATPNIFLAPITKLALQNGKHVLCEKPAGINTKEVKENIRLAKNNHLVYTVGFNHRFHPALARAKRLVSCGAIGKIHFIRGVYGHGGRIGYENEWRNKPELAGGGELLDQGVHLIDLAFWFLKNSFEKIHGTLVRNYWSQNLEDNAFITLQSRSGATVSLHASSTQWQKKFLWEIYGEHGFITTEGLGGNYGIETLRYSNRHTDTGNLDKEKILYFPPQNGFEDPDISLFSLWGNKFIASIKYEKEYGPSGSDALNALSVIEKIYQEQEEPKRSLR
ncbi:MAG: Gfo/Idh/MocA family oxidoreductase [Parcubacteria group bacterium]|nr:Gfo/Idh/MocA family oxidoreductase [Parcubacteria group bacterium]